MNDFEFLSLVEAIVEEAAVDVKKCHRHTYYGNQKPGACLSCDIANVREEITARRKTAKAAEAEAAKAIGGQRSLIEDIQ